MIDKTLHLRRTYKDKKDHDMDKEFDVINLLFKEIFFSSMHSHSEGWVFF